MRICIYYKYYISYGVPTIANSIKAKSSLIATYGILFYPVTNTQTSKHITLKVQVTLPQDTDHQKHIWALVNCSATSMFINSKLISKLGLTIRLPHAIIYGTNGQV